MLVELVDLVERLLVALGALVVFFLRGVLGFVDLRLGVLGFGVFLESAIHVDGADFALGEGGDWQRQGGEQGEGEEFFHKEVN